MEIRIEKAVEAVEQANEALHAQRIEAAKARIGGFFERIKETTYEPIPTGLKYIDDAIGGGMMRGQMVVLGAAPGIGKTALATWIFSKLALKRIPSIYLNLEMSGDQLTARRFSTAIAEDGHTLTPAEILQGYKRNPEELEWIKAAADKITAIDAYMTSPERIDAALGAVTAHIEAEAVAAEKAGQRAPFVVLDYLQKVTGNPSEDKTVVIQRATAAMKEYALKHKSIAFVIVAHNRESNKGGKITMEAARDTSDIEYTADLQMGISYTGCLKEYTRIGRDGKPYTYYRAPSDLNPIEQKFLTVKITKARFGESGVVEHLYFDGATMTFKQIGIDWIPIDESEGKTFEEFTGMKVDTKTGKATERKKPTPSGQYKGVHHG